MINTPATVLQLRELGRVVAGALPQLLALLVDEQDRAKSNPQKTITLPLLVLPCRLLAPYTLEVPVARIKDTSDIIPTRT